MTPMVWIGAQCGIVVDALPGTRHSDTSPCDYCGDGCEQVACAASEYEVGGGEDPPFEIEEWEIALECAMLAEVEGVPVLEASGNIWGKS